MVSFLLYISEQSASFVREKGSLILREISFYGWKWFMNWSIRSMLPNDVFRNSIKGQSWKMLQSQMGSKKGQLNAWRKKHGTFTPCVAADTSQHETTLERLWLQTKGLSRSAVEHNCLLKMSHIVRHPSLLHRRNAILTVWKIQLGLVSRELHFKWG